MVWPTLGSRTAKEQEQEFRKLVKVNPLQSLEYKALFNVCLCLIFTLLFYFVVDTKLAISKTFLLAGLLARYRRN